MLANKFIGPLRGPEVLVGNRQHVELLRAGVQVWNSNRPEWPDLKGEDFSGLDLSGALLDGAVITDSSLANVRLDGASLRGVFLSGSDLSLATLRGANLYYARLVGSTLCGAILDDASLVGATLDGSDLTGSSLRGANLMAAHLRGTNLSQADLSRSRLVSASLMLSNLNGATLNEAELNGATLVQTKVNGASFDRAFVYGIAAWDLEGTPASSEELFINREGSVTVSDLKIAQFVYLMLANDEVRNIIDTLTSRVVLILGRFSAERKAVLDALRAELRRRNCDPIVFDFAISETRNVTETVCLLAGMARYVIADLSDPRSVPQELQSFVRDVAVPVQPIIEEGQEPWSMFSDLRQRYHWVLGPYAYSDGASLIASLDLLVQGAEGKRLELLAERSS